MIDPDRQASAVVIQIDRRMLDQSLLVPWRRFAETVAQIGEWRAFALWVRAIVDANGALPAAAREAVRDRCPGLLQGAGPVAELWTAILAWASDSHFKKATQDGWIESAHFYSGFDPESETVWRHWEQTAAEWADAKPQHFPTFEEWWSAARRDTESTNRIDVERAVEGVAYSYWAILVILTNGDVSAIRERVEQIHPTFLSQHSFPDRADHHAVGQFRDALEAALIGRQLAGGLALDPVRRHLRFQRVVAYFSVCEERIKASADPKVPTFDVWLHQVDEFKVPDRGSSLG